MGIWQRFRTDLWRTAGWTFLYLFCTLALWWLTMFVPNGAIIVSGTYTANLLAIAASVLAFATVSRWLATLIVSVQSMFAILLYIVFAKATPMPGVLAEGVVHQGELVLLTVSVMLLVAAIVGVLEGESRCTMVESQTAFANSSPR